MSFDPDAYLAESPGTFDPDAYLGESSDTFEPDAYLEETEKPRIGIRDTIKYRSQAQEGVVPDSTAHAIAENFPFNKMMRSADQKAIINFYEGNLPDYKKKPLDEGARRYLGEKGVARYEQESDADRLAGYLERQGEFAKESVRMWRQFEEPKATTPEEREASLRNWIKRDAELELKDRIEAKRAAGKTLDEHERSIWNKMVVGAAENVGYQAAFTVHPGVALATAFADRTARLSTNEYDVDNDGNLYLSKAGDDEGTAAIKGLAGAAAETAIEVYGGKVVGKLLSKSARAILRRVGKKAPVTANLIGRAIKNYLAIAKVTKLDDPIVETWFEEYPQALVDSGIGLDLKQSEMEGKPFAERMLKAHRDFDPTEVMLSMAFMMGGQAAMSTASATMDHATLNRNLDNSLKLFGGLEDADLKGVSTKDKILMVRRVAGTMTPEKVEGLARHMDGKARQALKKMYDRQQFYQQAQAEGVEPTFELGGDGRNPYVDTKCGIGIIPEDGKYRVVNRDGTDVGVFDSAGEAIAEAKKQSQVNVVLDQQRQKKADYVRLEAERLAGGMPVRIFNTESEMLQEIPEIGQSPDYQAGITGVRHKGGMVLILDNLVSPSEVVRTIMHEGGAHEGIRRALGDKAGLDQFLGNLAGEQFEIGKRRLKLGGQEFADQLTEADEALATVYEHRLADPTAYQKSVAWLHNQLRRVAPNVKYTDADIEVLMADAQSRVMDARGDVSVDYIGVDRGYSGADAAVEDARARMSQEARAAEQARRRAMADEANKPRVAPVDDDAATPPKAPAQPQQRGMNQKERRAALIAGMEQEVSGALYPVEDDVRHEPDQDHDPAAQVETQAGDTAQQAVRQMESDERLKARYPQEYQDALSAVDGDAENAIGLLREQAKAMEESRRVSEQGRTILDKLDNKRTLTPQDIRFLTANDILGPDLYKLGYRRDKSTGEWRNIDAPADDADLAPTFVAPDTSVTAGQTVTQSPSEAQKKAGNYKKAHVAIDGHDITIENPVGSTRSGKDRNGDEWHNEMKTDYGYIKGTVGHDKDHLDVVIKPGYKGGSGSVFVVDQIDPDTGKFDEHKVVFGADTAHDAMSLYNSNYAAGWKGGAGVTELSDDQFKEWAYATGNRGPRGGRLSSLSPDASKAETEAPIQTPQEAPAAAPDAANGKPDAPDLEQDAEAETHQAPVEAAPAPAPANDAPKAEKGKEGTRAWTTPIAYRLPPSVIRRMKYLDLKAAARDNKYPGGQSVWDTASRRNTAGLKAALLQHRKTYMDAEGKQEKAPVSKETRAKMSKSRKAAAARTQDAKMREFYAGEELKQIANAEPIMIPEDELNDGDMVWNEGQWYKVTKRDDGTTVLEDGVRIEYERYDPVQVQGVVKPTDAAYPDAKQEHKEQEKAIGDGKRETIKGTPEGVADDMTFGEDPFADDMTFGKDPAAEAPATREVKTGRVGETKAVPVDAPPVRQDVAAMPKIIPYSADVSKTISNVDALPRGTGARYLEVIAGERGRWVAKQWRRKIPSDAGSGQTFIDMKPVASAKPTLSLESVTTDEIDAETSARNAEAVRKAMIERAASPMEGNAGDLTADLFGEQEGETPLFNARRDGQSTVKDTLTTEPAAKSQPNTPRFPRGAMATTVHNEDGIAYTGRIVSEDSGKETVTIRATKERKKGLKATAGDYGLDKQGRQITKDVTVPAELVRVIDAVDSGARRTAIERAAMDEIDREVLADLRNNIGDQATAVDQIDKVVERQDADDADPDEAYEGTRFRRAVTPEQDREYLAAVEAGDTATAQRMVDAAAKTAGLVGPFYHGTKAKGFTVFDRKHGHEVSVGSLGFFTTDKQRAKDHVGQNGELLSVYLRPGASIPADYEFNEILHRWAADPTYIEGVESIITRPSPGSGAVVAVVADSSQIKSADAVTRDDAGNVIPLSERFNAETPDIRFRRASDAEYLAAVEAGELRREYDAVVAAHTNADGTRKASWMLAPNWKPTNLTERQWVQVRTQNFKKWFGDWENDPKNASKVVDDNGEPMVVYRGGQKDRYINSRKDLGSNTKARTARIGFFHTNDAWIARAFADYDRSPSKEVYQNFLNIRNPLSTKSTFIERTTAFGNKVAITNQWGNKRVLSDAYDNYWYMMESVLGKKKSEITGEDIDTWVTGRIAAGFDGFIFRETGMDAEGSLSDHYVAFHPEQIKSATGNTGAFNADTPDIRFRRAVTPEQDADYLRAVEAGDMETAQRMVDEAAKRAGYMVGPVWHGGREFNVFDARKPSVTTGRPAQDAFYFTTSEENAGFYEDGQLKRGFLKGNFREADGTHPPTEVGKTIMENFNSDSDTPFDGVVLRDVLDGSHYSDIYAVIPDDDATTTLFKSSDPVTRDDQGNVIPLSERFNPDTPDIRFRLPGVTLDAEYMEAVEKGDRGGDNLVELLRKTKKDERDKAVAAWLERNPETAERLEKMVVDRERAAGYNETGAHGLAYGKLEGNSFDPNRLGSNTHAPSARLGFFFGSNETAKTYGQENLKTEEAYDIAHTARDIVKDVINAIPEGENDQIDFYREGMEYGEAFNPTNDDEANPSEFLDSTIGEVDDLLREARRYAADQDDPAYIDGIIDSAIAKMEETLEQIEYSSVYDSSVLNVRLKMSNPLVVDQQGKKYREESFYDIIRRAKANNNDSVIIKNTYDSGTYGSDPLDDIKVVFEPSQIKSADAITLDDQGNVIPLSERFNEASDDVRFRLRSAAHALNAHPGTLKDTDFIPMSVIWNAQFDPYRNGANSRKTPIDDYEAVVGGWYIDDLRTDYGASIDQMLLLNPTTLEPSEWMPWTNEEGRGVDSDLYQEWLEDGKQPPPIKVLETEGGNLRISDGHRRFAAALRAGRPVLALVSPMGPSPSGGREFHSKKLIGMTLTDKIAKMQAEGKLPEWEGQPWADRVKPFLWDDDIRFRRASDADYLRAVEQGDRGGDNIVELLRKTEKDERDKAVAAWLERNPETAERLEKMVADRARAVGSYIGPVYHGTRTDFNIPRTRGMSAFDEKLANVRGDNDAGMFFSNVRDTARDFAQRGRRGDHRLTVGEINNDVWPEGARIVDAYLKLDNPKEFNSVGDFISYRSKNFNRIQDALREEGHDGIVLRDASYDASNPDETWYIATDPSQIKSADPVTYDDTGRVIPLSERFNDASDDIRFRPGPRRAPVLTPDQQEVVRVAERAMERTPAPATRLAQPASAAQEAPILGLIRWGMGQDVADKIDRKLGDFRIPVKRLYERVMEKGGKFNRDTMEYAALAEKRNSLFGVLAGDMEERFVLPMTKALRDGGWSLDDLNHYAQALHAPYFNRMIAEARGGREAPGRQPLGGFATDLLSALEDDGWAGKGLSDAKAKETVDWFDSKPNAGRLREAAMLLVDMNRRILDQRVADGLMARQQAETWKNLSPYYVPLRKMQEVEDGDVAAPAGRNLASREIKRAVGHFGALNENSVVNSLTQMDAALYRGLMNKERQNLWRFLEANPDPDSYVLHEAVPTRAVKVRNADGTFTVQQQVDQSFVRKASPHDKEGTIVPVKFDGEVKYIEFKGVNARTAARAVKENALQGRAFAASPFIRGLGHMFKGVRTIYAVDFMLRNGQSDGLDAALIMAAEGNGKQALEAIKAVPHAWKVLWQHENGRPVTGPYAELFEEYRRSGSIMSNRWVDSTGDNWLKVLEKEMGIVPDHSKPVQAVIAVKDGVERLNTMVELGTRFSVYAGMRKNGASVQDAADYARNITVDFEKKGELTPVLNSVYHFSNVAIQGNRRFMQAMLKNPARGARVVGSVFAAGFLTALWNMLGFDDDNDEYDKLKDYHKYGRIAARIPGTNKMVQARFRGIPGWIYFQGVAAAETAFGKRTAGSFAMQAPITFLDTVNWLGDSSDLLTAILPPMLDPLAHFATNKQWTGRPLVPGLEYATHKPRSQLAYKSTPKVFKAVAEAINKLGGGDEVTKSKAMLDNSPEAYKYWWSFLTGSMLNVPTRSFDVMVRLAKGDDVPVKSVPFVRDFFLDMDDIENNEPFYQAKTAFEEVQYRYKGYDERGERGKMGELRRQHRYADRESIASERLKDMLRRIDDLKDRADAATGERKEQLNQQRVEAQRQFIELIERYDARGRRP